jgi:pimeloyl-ACP methyl ester carboxylesterase
MSRFCTVAICGCVFTACVVIPARTQAAPSCEQLIGWARQGANVVSAEPVLAAGLVPAHCRVQGTIDSTIGFELLLPSAWNGKLMMGGGGGYVGYIRNQAQAGLSAGPTPLERGYATTATDTGHRAHRLSAAWALDDERAREDFAHRSIHRTVGVSKDIVASYYEQQLERSYFLGCSNGGRQAMVAAQRYPKDFDGIVATSTAFDFPTIAAHFVTIQQAVFPDRERLESPVITSDSVALVAEQVNRRCDALDGVTDGVIDDPLTCPFRPDDLPKCAAEASKDCVTDLQLAAIKAVYDAPIIEGRRVASGFPYGGEMDPGGWPTWVTKSPSEPAPGAPNSQFAFATEFFKYFVFRDPNWDYSTYDFVGWHRNTEALGSLLNATNPDLHRFHAHGGKLILVHGWADSGVPAQQSIEYFERVQELDPRAADYLALFLLPGVGHCGGGPGPDRVDWIDALEEWVEHGEAPQSVLATKIDGSGRVMRNRYVCAYPNVARCSQP